MRLGDRLKVHDTRIEFQEDWLTRREGFVHRYSGLIGHAEESHQVDTRKAIDVMTGHL
jgi:hypothetical protein